MNEPALNKECAHRDRRRNVVVHALLSSHEALQNSRNPLDIYKCSRLEQYALRVDFPHER